MNYDQIINHLAESLKQDKSIVQPWRNKAMARLDEAVAFIRMGRTVSNRKDDNMVVGSQNVDSRACTCVVGVVDVSCPVHGGLIR